MRTRVRRAFTLIEILIVVVILGILAAIVIPQFTDASNDAMNANVRAQLQTIRSQIELFNVQFPNLMPVPPGGPYDDLRAAPGDATFWDDLVDYDYLQQNPRNPFAPAAEAQLVGAVPANMGWEWIAVDGDIFATDGMGVRFVE